MFIASFRRVCAYLLLPVLGSAAPGVFAGSVVVGALDYAPDTATSVPTLSEWGLMAMMGLLVLVAYRVLRERLQGKPLASVVLAGVLGLGVVAGGYWGRPALAVVATPFEFSNSAGGSYAFGISGYFQGTNTSGVPQRITRMEINNPPYVFSTTAPAPACVVGMVVPVGGVCNIRIASVFE